jgi:carbamoyl-phosphate synthase/aspartate carbamoyltransferase
VRQFSRQDLHNIFNVAHQMRTVMERYGVLNLLAGRVLCNLFYEPSTRTSASFETAMVRLGGQVVNVNQTTSSVAKGESLEDTIRTVGSYTDAIVIRHMMPGSAVAASKVSTVPIINAGDGIGEHPTQVFDLA